MSALVSLRDLAHRLGFSREHLELVARNINDHYCEFESTDARTGKVRLISRPSKELKEIQSRIAKRLINVRVYGAEVQGGVRGRSPATNASVHLQKDCVVCVDVRKFFPSVGHAVVHRMLSAEFGFGRQVAALVTRLVTYRGQLPQGAPSSTAIANALLHIPVDGLVLERANACGCAYTRFVDDLTVSGRNPCEVINLMAKRLSQRQLAISRSAKLKIMPRTGPQEVTGLLVNGRKPSLSKERRDRVRAAVHEWSQMPGGERRRRSLQSVRGRIGYVKQHNLGSGLRLERQLKAECR